jgi:hypothetical protein
MKRTSSIRGARRAARVLSLGLLAIALALLGAGAGAARAATPSWLEAEVIEPLGENAIYGLSCASQTTCLAASDVPIVQDGGLSYEPGTDPDPTSILQGVSCAPGTHFCMFIDANGGGFTYNNGNFGTRADFDGDVELDSISCPTSSLCMAIDHNNTVFKYSSGSWNGGTPLTVPSTDGSFTNFVNVSCVSSAFCVALASTDSGLVSYTWSGSAWSSASSPFDVLGNHAVSLSCTSTTFCLETDDVGNADVFNGSSWSSPHQVDNFNSEPVLYSSCVGTSCVALDFFDNFYRTSDGTTWTSAVNIHSSTGISGVGSLTCATATLCVAGDGVGDATTYAIPPTPTKPVLTGTGILGHALALTHASVQTPSVWYYDDWRRCDNPDATCTLNPISTSLTSYTLGAADVHKYIDAREVIGFGFDEEGPIVSNIVGPISSGVPTPGTPKFAGVVSTTRTGLVTIALRCSGGPCTGKVKLTTNKTLGSAKYSIAAGKTAKIKIQLNSAGKKQLKKHHGRLTVTLVITPTKGSVTRVTIKLRVKH